MYSKEQKDIALRIYHQIESVTETIRILGYPTRRNLYTWIAEENTPLVSQRGIEDDSILFSVNWYPFISWCPFESRLMYQKSNAHLSKSDKLYSPLGIFAVLRYSFMAFTKSCGLLKYCFTKSYDFTSCIRRFVLQNSLGFFPERLN